MRIQWYGHAAFLVETQGVRIILDPYRSPDSGGYEPIDEPADVVVVTLDEPIGDRTIVDAFDLPPRPPVEVGDPRFG